MRVLRKTWMVVLVIVFAISACSKDDDPCTQKTWYEDADGDGLGNPNVSQESCEQPNGFVQNVDDADDSGADTKPTILWQGSKIMFTKADGADPSQEANQDRITDKVWITRGNQGGQIYNAVSEGSADKNNSPAGTEWALGSISAGVKTLKFKKFRDLAKPKNLLNKNLVLHIPAENIYIDLKFTSWSDNKKGGFAYQRSTSSQ